jgi:uncharacterized protein (TIGR03083 family)
VVSSDPIAVLRTSHELLRRTVEPLGPDDIRQRAYPANWSIAQVLSHLGSGAEINALILEAGVADEPPPEQDTYRAIWAVWDAKTPEQQVADALEVDGAMVDRMESLRGRDELRFRAWLGPVDLTGLAIARLFEHAVHTWDVVVAVDPTAPLAPDAVAVILPSLDRLVGFAAKPAGRTARIRVTTMDPTYDLALVLGEQSTVERWNDGPADATVHLPAEAFVRLIYGRLDPDHTPPVEAEGVTLDDLRAVFPGF